MIVVASVILIVLNKKSINEEKEHDKGKNLVPL